MTPAELTEIPGIGEKTVERIRKVVTDYFEAAEATAEAETVAAAEAEAVTAAEAETVTAAEAETAAKAAPSEGSTSEDPGSEAVATAAEAEGAPPSSDLPAEDAATGTAESQVDESVDATAKNGDNPPNPEAGH